MSNNDFLPYYQGRAKTIVVTTTAGVTVQFPAMHLRKHLSSQGIHGFFCLETKNNKFLSLNKLSG